MLWTRRLSCISQLTAARAKRRSEGSNGGCLNGYEIAGATAPGACLASAATRVLGATPGQVSVCIAAAQAPPALAGAALGIPADPTLFAVLRTGLRHTAGLVARHNRASRGRCGGSPDVHSLPAGGPRPTRIRPADRRATQPAGGSSTIPPSARLGRGPHGNPHPRSQCRSPPP